MYYVATNRHRTTPGVYSSSMLFEVSSKADVADLEARYDLVYRTDATTAHRWVRNGGNHNTPLYWDEYTKRVRRAAEDRS